jgi:hypothetical protein
MKTNRIIKRHIAALALLSTFSLQPSVVFAQGSLTPPGAPAPTMKTLAQIEPRFPISVLPTNITLSGSYYVVANLVGVAGTNGITITTNNVTVDLNGFSLIGVPGSQDGIAVAILNNNIAIINGTVRNWGGNGISGSGQGTRVQQVHSRSNAVLGIRVFGPALIKECTASGNLVGIYTVDGSIIEHCAAFLQTGAGFQIGGSCVVRACAARLNSGAGIVQGSGGSSVILENSCSMNASVGISVCYGNLIRNNTCDSNGTAVADGAGIETRCGANRVEDNLVTGNGIGIRCFENGKEMVFRNTAKGNMVTNYQGLIGNDFGPIGTAATATSPWANISN